jgi:FkbM family methyltransferase
VDRYRSFVSLFEEIFIRQTYMFECTNPTPLILDCGSNIGMASLYFKHRYPGARIVAFEPNPAAYSLLERNIQENHLEHVQLVKAAVGQGHGTATLYRDPAHASSLRTSLSQHVGAVSVGQCEIVKLSDYIDGHVDFVKMDIEGHELEVFQELCDAGKLNAVQEYVFECHNNIGSHSTLEKILSMLSGHGYLYQICSDLRVDSDAFLRTNREQDLLVRATRRRDESFMPGSKG